MGIRANYASFFREFLRDFRHTGAVLPSGPFLATALAKPMLGARSPMRILEVGPGTGAVTAILASRLREGDRLDAVEINPRFADLLRQRISRDLVFADHRDDIEIITAPIEDLLGESVYDLIVSGLPLNNFNTREIRSIFEAFTRLLKPGGALTYFEYALVRRLKAPFVPRRERYRLLRVARLVQQYITRHQVRRERVILNVPPAIVRTLRLKPVSCEQVVEALS